MLTRAKGSHEQLGELGREGCLRGYRMGQERRVGHCEEDCVPDLGPEGGGGKK